MMNRPEDTPLTPSVEQQENEIFVVSHIQVERDAARLQRDNLLSEVARLREETDEAIKRRDELYRIIDKYQDTDRMMIEACQKSIQWGDMFRAQNNELRAEIATLKKQLTAT